MSGESNNIDSNDIGEGGFSDLGSGDGYENGSLPERVPRSTKRPLNTPKMLTPKQRRDMHELDLLPGWKRQCQILCSKQPLKDD